MLKIYRNSTNYLWKNLASSYPPAGSAAANIHDWNDSIVRVL